MGYILTFLEVSKSVVLHFNLSQNDPVEFKILVFGGNEEMKLKDVVMRVIKTEPPPPHYFGFPEKDTFRIIYRNVFQFERQIKFS